MGWLNIRKLFSEYQHFIQPWPAIDWKASNFEWFVYSFYSQEHYVLGENVVIGLLSWHFGLEKPLIMNEFCPFCRFHRDNNAKHWWDTSIVTSVHSGNKNLATDAYTKVRFFFNCDDFFLTVMTRAVDIFLRFVDIGKSAYPSPYKKPWLRNIFPIISWKIVWYKEKRRQTARNQ